MNNIKPLLNCVKRGFFAESLELVYFDFKLIPVIIKITNSLPDLSPPACQLRLIPCVDVDEDLQGVERVLRPADGELVGHTVLLEPAPNLRNGQLHT